MKAFPYTLDPEQIPTRKNWDVTRADYEGGPCVCYACPSSCWAEHVKSWSKELRDGNKTAPQPHPMGHCMFDNPIAYGMVRYGCTDPQKIRKAWDRHVRALLDGWDKDIPKDKLDVIVNATIDAKMKGVETGGAPFMACIAISADL
jgi:hypothetical protein